MSRIRRTCCGWIASALLLCSGAAFADYKQDYQDGLEAADKGNWSEVQRLMRSALSEESRPTARMRAYGTVYIPYVPHYYLGLASARLGDCSGAVAAFGNAASRGVVSKLSALSATQSQEQTRCTEMLAQANAKPEPPTTVIDKPVPPVVVANNPVPEIKPPVSQPEPKPSGKPVLSADQIAPSRSALARVDQQVESISRQLRAQPLAGTGDARALSRDLDALRQRRQQTGSSLEQARTGGDTQLLSRVQNDARELEGSLGMLDDRVRSASTGLAQAQEARSLEQSRQHAETALTQLEKTLGGAQAAGIGNSARVKAVTDARTRLQQLKNGSDRKSIDAAVDSLAKLALDLEKAIAAAPKPAPAQLRSLVSWYLAADYAQVAAWDQLDRLPDTRARSQALLLRAASRWHLYVRGGEQDGKLSAAVDIDLREAKRLDQTLKPNPMAFSPRLVDRFATL